MIARAHLVRPLYRRGIQAVYLAITAWGNISCIPVRDLSFDLLFPLLNSLTRHHVWHAGIRAICRPKQIQLTHRQHVKYKYQFSVKLPHGYVADHLDAATVDGLLWACCRSNACTTSLFFFAWVSEYLSTELGKNGPSG